MPSMVGTVGEEHARKAVWPASKAGAKVCAVGRASSSQKRTGCSLIFKDPPLDLSMISLFFFSKGCSFLSSGLCFFTPNYRLNKPVFCRQPVDWLATLCKIPCICQCKSSIHLPVQVPREICNASCISQLLVACAKFDVQQRARVTTVNFTVA